MLKKLDSYIKIIFEDIDKSYKNDINDSEILYEDMTIAIVPGSFKPPHKGHWEMVMNYVNMKDVDKVIVLISNISTKAISNRSISMTNLNFLGKIKSFIEKNDIHTDEIDEGLETIDKNIDNMTYSMLDEIFAKKFIPSCDQNYANEKKFIELKVMITDYMNGLHDKLFKSIRKAGDFEITPEISKEIFEIFVNAYNVSDKVDIEVSESASPITDTLGFVNYKCKNCTILLGVSEKGGDQSRWNGIEKSIKNDSVKIIPSPVKVETMISATDLRNNISNLKKEYFPNNLTNEDFNKIVELLK